MPELPEVETVRRGLSAMLEGDVIASVELRRKDLRVPFPPRFAARLAGRRIDDIARRAKYLLFRLDNASVVVAHLGMSGSFRITHEGRTAGLATAARGASKSPAHDHVVWHMRSGAVVTYNDPRRFGLMDLIPAAELESSRYFADMGVEPLGNRFDARALARLFAGRRTSLKAALLDQRLIAGLGNIYVCEALWRAGLAPARAAGSVVTKRGLPGAGARRLADAVRAVLNDALAAGGSSLRDYVGTSGEMGMFQNDFGVYDREGEPCLTPDCRGTVARITQGGRSTFFCPRCQG
jgi:formamidopyrimidine-DNA glycosylase